MKTITVAVVGNPNTGKSTLINAIAGTHLRVGNWPGVTVEKKTATLKVDDFTVNLVDLPGTYSLNPYTLDEEIARNFLVKEKPDVIIDVVDSTNLERNLYFTIQLLELGIPLVMALNIYDEAKKIGYEIHIDKLEQLLGIKVVPTVATKKEGVKELLETLKEIAKNPEKFTPRKLNYGEEIENSLKIIEEGIYNHYKNLTNVYPLRWLSLKLLEGDEKVFKETGIRENEEFLQKAKKHFLEVGEDIEDLLTDARYGIAHGVTKDVLFKKEVKRIDLTDRIDKIVLNRWVGLPLFLLAMWLVFKFVFDFSSPFCDWIDLVIGGFVTKWANYLLTSIGSPEWFVSLVTDGIIAGVGAVLVFIPLIGTMMFILTFLEGSGYMARAAFIIDRFMHSIGLHGKSFVPMLLGFGCNVPSIYATRVLETERDRKLTAMLCPLMSCGARLPVYVLFAGAFFGNNAPTVIWSLYVLGILMAILLGFILNKTLFKGFAPVFLMELPPYRIPTFRDLMIHTWQKLKHFVIKAGTVILAVSIIMWFMLNIPYGVEKEKSVLGRIGKITSPIFKPLGFGTWQASSALITGVIAKEVVVSTMAEIYVPTEEETEQVEKTGFFEDLRDITVSFFSAFKDAFKNIFSGFGVTSLSVEEEENTSLVNKLRKAFTPLSAYAFLIFVLLYLPCAVFASVLLREFGSWKFLGQVLIIYILLPWLAAFIVYQGGKILGF